MSTPITDIQLEYELEDLYLSSKHWLSDIDFVADEIKFLNSVTGKYLQPGHNVSDSAMLHHCKMMLCEQQEEIISLKIRVIAYLNFLAPFISGQISKISIDLIDRHTALDNEMIALFESIKILKKDLFPIAEKAMAQTN